MEVGTAVESVGARFYFKIALSATLAAAAQGQAQICGALCRLLSYGPGVALAAAFALQAAKRAVSRL